MDDGAGLSADQFLSILTQEAFFLVFLVTGWEAPRRPRRASVDTALFSAAIALIVAWQWAAAALHLGPNPVASTLVGGLLMALPYLMLRLVDDFAMLPRRIVRLAGVGLGASIAGIVLLTNLPAGDPRRVAAGSVLLGPTILMSLTGLFFSELRWL